MKLMTKLAFDLLSLLAFVLGVGWVSGSGTSTHLPSQRGWILAFLLAVVFATGCKSPAVAPTAPVCHEVVTPAYDVCETVVVPPSSLILVCRHVEAVTKVVCQ